MAVVINMQSLSRGEWVRVNCAVVVVVVALTILSLTVCRCQGASVSGRSEAYAKAQAAKKSGGSNGVSSYFRRDPYGPNTYAFGFEVNDKRTGNVQFRDERRYVNGSVEGSFGYVRPDGRVIVTHFQADDEHGYSAKTDAIGERHEWQARWPTKRPGILMQRPPELATGDVVFDKDLRLNVTSSRVPDAVAGAVQQQHGVDVNKVDLQTDVIDPTVLDIINGKLPLQKRPATADKGTFGIETVDNFIPPDFPIVPFQLPEQNETNTGAAADAGDSAAEQSQRQKQQQQQQQQQQRQQQNKYNMAKLNNAEKSIDAAVLRKSDGGAETKVKKNAGSTAAAAAMRSSSRTGAAGADQPKPLTAAAEPDGADRQAWYEQIIDETRNEFLQNLPDLP